LFTNVTLPHVCSIIVITSQQRQLSDVGTTEWLLTPSNNHTRDRYSYPDTEDVISAEWLLRSHDNEGKKAPADTCWSCL